MFNPDFRKSMMLSAACCLLLIAASAVDTAQAAGGAGSARSTARAPAGNIQSSPLGAPVFAASLRMEQDSPEFPPLVPVVQLSFDGSKPLFFIVDSGAAGGLKLLPWAARELNLKRVPDPEQAGVQRLLTGTITLVGKAPGEQHKLSDLTVSVLTSEMSAAAQAPSIAGVIGIELFQRYMVQIDPAAKTLNLYAPAKQPVTIDGAGSVLLLSSELTGDPARRDVEVTFPGSGDAQKIRMLLDTGGESFQIPSANASALADLQLDPKPRAFYAAKGWTAAYLAMVPEGSAGTWRFTSPVLTLVRKEEGEIPRLGMRLLSRFRTTVDYVHNQLLLEPISGAGRVVIPATVGFEIARDGRQFVVVKLQADSAAQKAGILPGDSVLAIDDSPLDTANITAEAVNKLLPKRAGQSVRLVVRHRDGKGNKGKRNAAGATASITVTAEYPFLPAEKKLRFGLGVSPDPAGDDSTKKWIVSYAPANSSAGTAGLLEGDEIVTINGKPSSEITRDYLSALFDEPKDTTPVSVTVRRNGRTEPLTVELVPQKQSLLDLLTWKVKNRTISAAEEPKGRPPMTRKKYLS